MSPRSRRLLWLAPALSLALGAVTTALAASIPAEQLPREDRLDVLDVLFALGFVAYAAVGALITATHPRNAVGWLFCAVGLALPVTGLLWTYATYSIQAGSGGLPADEAAAWAFAWSSDPLLIAVVLLLLLFPDGRFMSRAWRMVGLAAMGVTLVRVLAIALDPGPLYLFDSVSNPVGIAGAGGLLGALAAGCAAATTVLFLLAGASVIARYRRAHATQRQQIKWLAFASVVVLLMIMAFSVLELATDANRGAAEVITSVLALLALAAIPVGAGVAMRRHRLYDVDLVINRTLVYGALTATLAGAYLGSVLLLQLVLEGVTRGSGPAVAASTLAVAALFRPARARIQELVDRRFYRRRYDAQRTLESFSARLRDELSLDALRVELRAAVADTMQPAHVSLWLREARQPEDEL